MNLLALLIGLRPWRAPTATSRFTRVMAAVSLLSIEMQAVTWLGVGSLRSLAVLNVLVAAALWRAWPPAPVRPDEPRVGLLGAAPLLAVLLLAALVAGLNLGLPLEAADPYHLDKVARIEAVGTLAYDAGAEPKVNVLSSTYELLLADLAQVPAAGGTLVRLHGVLGLLLWLLAIGSMREMLAAPPGWTWALLLAVPVVFQQLVLVKNDLFVGAVGLVVLTWVVTRGRTASWRDSAWASWLTGLVVAVKLSTLPLLVVLAGALVLRRPRAWSVLGGAVLGALAGLVTGGLLFTLVENARIYGVLMPVAGIGGATAGPAEAVTSLGRFALSLFDLGLLTRVLWPGRGGWGGTLGLPLIWALVVLVVVRRRVPEARPALLVAAVYLALFAGAFVDADLAHRLVLGPGVLLVGVAVHGLAGLEPRHAWLRRAAVPVAALSALQILRSAVLYVMRA